MTSLPGPLVSSEWLRAHGSQQGELVVADVRWVPGGSACDAFERGHIPGAAMFDLDTDLAAPAFDGPGRHPLPPPEAFAETMGAAGVGDATLVVAYDDARGSVAARLWWMLDTIGHPVALLDGGLDAWNGHFETGPVRARARAAFSPRPWPRARIVGAAEVAEALGLGASVVDARAAERYRGEVEPFDRAAGHIPGARSAPWTQTIDPETGRLRSPGVLREWFDSLGVGSEPETIAHCGSGVTACQALLAMRVAGLHDARLYVGSWSDWSSDPARPVATGSAPGSFDRAPQPANGSSA